MPLFTSPRERRLWLWSLVTVTAIYATLGPARFLVDALRERNLLRLSFALLVLLVVTAIVTQWIKRGPDWREVGVALGVGLVYLVAFLRIENPVERTHLIEYGVVAALIHQALQERMRNGRPVPGPAALAVLITALVGLVDEGLQAVIPSRVFDWNDVLFNALAAFMVIVARLAIAPVRRPGWRLWFVWVIASGFGFGWSMDPSLFGEPRTYEVLPSLPILAMPHYQSVAVGGIVVGAFQWLALRRYIAASLLWLPATIGAVVLSGAALVALGGLDADQGWVVSAALYGTLAGLLQWTVLRGQTTRAAWWVWGSTVGWVVAIPAGGIIGPPGWAAYGAISGTVLVWLLQSGAHELHAPDDLMHRAD